MQEPDLVARCIEAMANAKAPNNNKDKNWLQRS